MEKKRLWHQLRLLLIRGSLKRAEYLRKNHVFHEIGENVYIQSRKIPLYANLIALHNNIRIAANVNFITHDVMHTVLGNTSGKPEEYCEKVGCIEIFDNVFVGSNSTILYGTRIGPNAIIASGAVVTKDVPPGTVVGGVPARVIGSFDKLLNERKVSEYPSKLIPRGQIVSTELGEYMWQKFREKKEEYNE